MVRLKALKVELGKLEETEEERLVVDEAYALCNEKYHALERLRNRHGYGHSDALSARREWEAADDTLNILRDERARKDLRLRRVDLDLKKLRQEGIS